MTIPLTLAFICLCLLSEILVGRVHGDVLCVLMMVPSLGGSTLQEHLKKENWESSTTQRGHWQFSISVFACPLTWGFLGRPHFSLTESSLCKCHENRAPLHTQSSWLFIFFMFILQHFNSCLQQSFTHPSSSVCFSTSTSSLFETMSHYVIYPNIKLEVLLLPLTWDQQLVSSFLN